MKVKASFPESVWAGNSGNRRSIEDFKAPDARDYERLACEVIAIQTYLSQVTEKGNTLDTSRIEKLIKSSNSANVKLIKKLETTKAGKEELISVESIQNIINANDKTSELQAEISQLKNDIGIPSHLVEALTDALALTIGKGSAVTAGEKHTVTDESIIFSTGSITLGKPKGNTICEVYGDFTLRKKKYTYVKLLYMGAWKICQTM